MKHFKTLVLLVALFPTTALADEIYLIAKNTHKPVDAYEQEIQRLDAESSSLAASLLNRRTASGTTRAPASDDFAVTLIKKSK